MVFRKVPFSTILALSATPATLFSIGKIREDELSFSPSDNVFQCSPSIKRASQIHRATEAVHRYMVEMNK
jgi:hypothetical protein